MNDPFEQRRLEALMDEAGKSYRRAAQDQADKSAETAKEHTEYFEKLAFGAGAVLTAIVSFVGSKRILYPSWLLRATITALGFSIITVLIRNAVYPYYVGSVYWRRALKAEIDRDGAKAEYFSRFSAMDIDTGRPIDAVKYVSDYQKNRPLVDAKLIEIERTENRSLKWCGYLEKVCLLSTAAAAVFLVFLVWKNF